MDGQLQQNMTEMNKNSKTIVTFILATFTPAVAWIVFIPFLFLIAVSFNPIALGPENLNIATKTFRFFILVVGVYFWNFFLAAFVLAFSFVHMLFLGIPTFIVANRLRIIRWYTVLTASVLIGGGPYILITVGSPKNVVLAVVTTMSIFGFSAGMAFWILWRYWVAPENYTKKPISSAPLTP
jgi:hypothetical protein